VSLTSGTILHNTKTPLTLWFWAAYLMTTDKRGVSALLLQHQLGLQRYETAWMILHKLRRATVNAARAPLHGEVEIDDTWVGGTQAGIRGSRQLRGRRAALVVVAVEKRGRASGRTRMAVIPDFRATTINSFITQNVALGSTIHTDGLKSLAGLQEIGFKHIPRTQPLRTELSKDTPSVVPLADRAIGTSSNGSSALITGSAAPNSRPTSTSSSLGTIAESNPWRPSKLSLASAPPALRHLTTASAMRWTFRTCLFKPNPLHMVVC
jgi:transposase-like protein